MISPLLTDLYQLTMAYGYWKLQMHEQEAVFHQVFRNNPFGGRYALSCGLGTVIEFLQNWRFQEDELHYLESLMTSHQEKLFSREFIDYLRELKFTCDVDAVPEGSLVFPQEPLIQIKGPLLQGQLLESTLLNIINFQTLIATKASRVCLAARGDPVLEFGMRRAQGPDGALSASRAAFIGGCTATSNVLAGKCYGIPVRGTHAHSWVTAFCDEISAFKAYASVMPHNCTLLVDTYNTIEGVKNAIRIGEVLREQGNDLQGIRLDSGDMAALSKKARALLDDAGFFDTKIIASNKLDEYVIEQMKRQGAKVSQWGVGTHLVTGYDHPALDGVYKLSALKDKKGQWQYKLKLSEQAEKISNPGVYQVRRYFEDHLPLMDVIYDAELGISATPEAISLDGTTPIENMTSATTNNDLLVPVFRQGKLVMRAEPLSLIRERSVQAVHDFMKKFATKDYPVGLEKNLHALKQQLISNVSKFNGPVNE